MSLELLKRYFWIINSILVVLAAFVSADIFNNLLRKEIEPPVRVINIPLGPKRGLKGAVSQKRDIGFYSVIYERNIFNSKASASSIIKPGEGPAPLSELKAKLIGTVVGQDKLSFAVIQDSLTQEVGIYRVDDMLMNEARIIRIERSRVVLYRNGRQESLVIYEEEYSPTGEKIATSTEAMPSNYDVKQVGQNRYTISKEEVDRSTQNLGKLMTEARLVPNLESGNIQGYKIFAIKPDSLYSKIGLQNGDVIQRVNGIDISDPEKALQLFQQLKNERYFQIDITRNNQRMTMTYNVR